MYQFQTDQFSRKISAPLKLNKQKSAQYKKILQKFYPHFIDQYTNYYSIGELGINSSNVLIETANKTYLLKKTSKVNICIHSESCKIARSLNELNQPVPSLYPNYYSKLYCESEEYIYSLWEYIIGNYFSGNGNELTNIANSTRQLFGILKTFPPRIKEPLIGPSLEKSITILQKFLRSKDLWGNVLNYDQISFLSRNIKDYEKSLSLLKSNLSKSKRLQLVHYDLHPHNILMDKDEVISFLDLDSIRYYSLEMACGFSAYKLYRQYMTLDHGIKSHTKVSFKDFCHLICPEMSFEDFILGGMQEVTRRACYILEPLMKGINSPWISVLGIQLLAIYEIRVLSET